MLNIRTPLFRFSVPEFWNQSLRYAKYTSFDLLLFSHFVYFVTLWKVPNTFLEVNGDHSFKTRVSNSAIVVGSTYCISISRDRQLPRLQLTVVHCLFYLHEYSSICMSCLVSCCSVGYKWLCCKRRCWQLFGCECAEYFRDVFLK